MTAWLRDDLEELDTRESDNLQFMPGEKRRAERNRQKMGRQNLWRYDG